MFPFAFLPYSREVARFALFGGRLPKVKVLTADVPININLLSTIVNAYINLTISVGFEPVSGFVVEVTVGYGSLV